MLHTTNFYFNYVLEIKELTSNGGMREEGNIDVNSQ